MKKQTGIWIDLRNAWIINLPTEHEGETAVQHISSEIEKSAHAGGVRSKSPWGPQGGDNQRGTQERLHHDEKHYFTTIFQSLPPATEEVVIFGPSEAKFGLRNLLLEQHNAPDVLGLESADQMTEHQMIAWVRDFFKRPSPRKQPKYGHETKT